MRQRPNRILEAAEEGRLSYGLNIQSGSEEMVEIAGAAGLDFAIVDAEHGAVHVEGLGRLLRAADAVSITPLVRLPGHDAAFIATALDAGAMGIVVPSVQSAAEASRIVALAKYKSDEFPGGRRGACPTTRATWHLAEDWQATMTAANAHTLVWLLIEEPSGAAAIDAIVRTSGVAAVVPGPFDLAQAMGRSGDVTHPEVRRVLGRIARAARDNGVGVVAVLLASDAASLRAEANFWRDAGATAYWIGSDRRIASLAVRARFGEVRDVI